jgi:hypothetical protein
MPASVGGIEVVEVVTRYGAKHLAIKNRFDDTMSRYFTACMGTSSWTIESWAANPDHPLGLTADEMVGLDLCSRCVAILRPEPPTPVVYTADSVMAEQEAAEWNCCTVEAEAPCSVEGCQRQHTQRCSRKAGHPPDVHIAIGPGAHPLAGPEITSVWAVK